MKSRTYSLNSRKKYVFWLIIGISLLLGGGIFLQKAIIGTNIPKEAKLEVQTKFSVEELQWEGEVKEEKEEPAPQEPQEPQETLQAYQNMPQQINGYTVLGKLIIPKIELETYILDETNKTSLNTSVTKLEGPGINEVGNFCITGHNYLNANMFGKLKKLEIGDTISMVDPYDRKIDYQVYAIEKVSPKDVSCVSQETEGDREVTLITCTLGAIQRLVVKCIEIYD